MPSARDSSRDFSRRERIATAALAVLATGILVLGWRLLWFLTDDAYIAFRYVSNSILGHGYVWNAEPFRPVEGYTSFLWVALLDGAWRLFGVEPPAIANWITLALSILAVLLGVRMATRLRWSASLRPVRVACVGLVLLGVTANRTFLTWASSGFETALFNLLILGWLYKCLYTVTWRARDVLALSISAALLALTRPDGLLYVGATFVVWAMICVRSPSRARLAIAALPLVIVPLHLLWRHSVYGLWLPNTYYAKVVSPWPEAGVRFLLSFAIEYALWLWPLVAAVAVARGAWRAHPAAPRVTDDDVRFFGYPVPFVVRALCLATLVAHVAYYALIVGGDHFEYRILSHLVVPIFVSFVWLLNRIRVGPRVALVLLAGFVALSLPVPWTHWALTRNLSSRNETRRMRVAIAPHWPPVVRGYADAFDRVQAWLIGHWICVRHQEHKVNQQYLTSLYPTRREGERISSDGFPVHAFQAVGVAAWSLPHVNIIDLLGLNDYVVARTPVDRSRQRGMAHERRAPEGYAGCFAPNVFLRPGEGLRAVAREQPLTAEAIRECEASWTRRTSRVGDGSGSRATAR